MEQKLQENFDFVQGQIEKIKANKHLHVNQILDLKSYVEIQKNIVEAIRIAKGMAN
jgi:hypothetical protein